VVDLGIVFASDAHYSERVDLIATFPSNLHDPILYPIAAVKDASERAAAFLSFLSQESAAATMRTHGFQPVSPAPADGGIPPSK
jgi:molybdate transport system substrate-binding protein